MTKQFKNTNVPQNQLKKVLEDNEDLIDENISLAQFSFILVDPNITNTTALSIKCSKEAKIYNDIDYVFYISDDIWHHLNSNETNYLLLLQLMKCKISTNKDGEFLFKTKKIDVDDFMKFLEKYGSEWINQIKTKIISIRELSEDKDIVLV